MKNFQKMFVPLIALLFVLFAAPAKAEEEEDGRHCTPCAECHPDSFWCLQCAERVLRANSGCCGQGDATSYCHADSGFTVSCSGTTTTCQCDSEGRNCERDLIYE
jgi:hypothetical protein